MSDDLVEPPASSLNWTKQTFYETIIIIFQNCLFSEIIHTMDITFTELSDFEILRKQISKFF